jgi:hypothetical protein
MTEVDNIWEELSIAEHKERAMKWAEDAFPQFLNNEALVAQLFLTNVLNKTLPPPVDIITITDLLEKFKKFTPVVGPDGKESKLYATIEVVMVQMLDDKRGYFGCPKCYAKVDRRGGYCTNPEHPGEEPHGVNLTFQKWQAGDGTGNIIVTFGPSSHQNPADTVNYTLTIQGSMNNRDGSFNAWEIVNKKAPKKLRKLESLKKTENVEIVKEVIVDEKGEDDVFEDPEEATAAIFGAGVETTAGTGGTVEARVLTTAAKDTVIRSFKKLLKQHYTKEPNTTKNILNWLSVQPQFKDWAKGSERDVIIAEFLAEQEAAGMFAYDDAKKEKIISKLEE